MSVTVLNDKTNVSTGKPNIAGAIYRAPLSGSPTIPTDCTTALAAAYKCLGYVSEDGLTNSVSNENEDIKAWGGDVVLTVKKGRKDTFRCTLIEVLNEDVLKTVYGDSNVTVAVATQSAPKTISVASNNSDQTPCCYIVEMVTQGGNPKRIVIPNGTVTEVGDVVYKDETAVGYEVTITAEVDETGNTHYEYMTVGTATGT